jgi:hypothetical protein
MALCSPGNCEQAAPKQVISVLGQLAKRRGLLRHAFLRRAVHLIPSTEGLTERGTECLGRVQCNKFNFKNMTLRQLYYLRTWTGVSVAQRSSASSAHIQYVHIHSASASEVLLLYYVLSTQTTASYYAFFAIKINNNIHRKIHGDIDGRDYMR